MHSESADDCATIGCLLLRHAIAAPDINMTQPEHDLLLSKSEPQSASLLAKKSEMSLET